MNEGLSDGTYLGMAIAAALLFFVSLLMHEYGHALVARREGMEIEGITLWLFGGVARFKGMFPSAGAEFRIAIAGPVDSALGCLFVLFAWLAPAPEAVDAAAAWLGYINLTLLVFNLLPALPLDGGRVLRSVLWAARNDFAWATRIAARVGRAFGYLFIAVGLGFLFFQGAFSGAWLAFIGWFLLQAAGAEDRYLLARQALAGLRVKDLMVRDPETAKPDMTLGDFMDKLVSQRRYTRYPSSRTAAPKDSSRSAAWPRYRAASGTPGWSGTAWFRASACPWSGRPTNSSMPPRSLRVAMSTERSSSTAIGSSGSSR